MVTTQNVSKPVSPSKPAFPTAQTVTKLKLSPLLRLRNVQ
jgi:hypothetical protein